MPIYIVKTGMITLKQHLPISLQVTFNLKNQ